MHKYLPKFFIFLDQYNSEIFKKKNINIGIVYRNYNDENRENQLIKIAEACKKSRYQLFVSNDLKLAYKFKADGIYIPSFNKRITLNKASLNKNFKIIGSAHNQMEIKKKLDQGCEAIFLSPLFRIEKNRSYLGICRFKLLTLKYKKKFIALGGIRKQNINNLKMLNIYGMAGISYLKKNRPINLGRFL